MTQNFNIDIISPSKSIFSSELSEATIPAYEGEMGVLKDHIPFITFLRPGLIEVLQGGNTQKFFVETIRLYTSSHCPWKCGFCNSHSFLRISNATMEKEEAPKFEAS